MVLDNFDGAGDQIPSPKKTLNLPGIAVATEVQLEVYQQDVILRNELTSGNDADYTIRMPNVTEASGRTYTFHCLLQAGDGALLVTPWGAGQVGATDESEDWQGDYDLDLLQDHLTLYSNGRAWIEVNNSIA